MRPHCPERDTANTVGKPDEVYSTPVGTGLSAVLFRVPVRTGTFGLSTSVSRLAGDIRCSGKFRFHAVAGRRSIRRNAGIPLDQLAPDVSVFVVGDLTLSQKFPELTEHLVPLRRRVRIILIPGAEGINDPGKPTENGDNHSDIRRKSRKRLPGKSSSTAQVPAPSEFMVRIPDRCVRLSSPVEFPVRLDFSRLTGRLQRRNRWRMEHRPVRITLPSGLSGRCGTGSPVPGEESPGSAGQDGR